MDLRAPALACGVLFGTTAGLLTFLPFDLALSAAAAAMCFAALARSARVTSRSVWLTCVFLGAANGAAARDAVYFAPVTLWHQARASAGEADEAVVLRGVLSGDATIGPYGALLRLRLTAVFQDGAWRPLSGRLHLRVTGTHAQGQAADWRQGRSVETSAVLRRPQVHLNPGGATLARQALDRPFDLTGSVKSAVLVAWRAGPWWRETAGSVRHHVRRAVRAHVGTWSSQSSAIVTAILVGDRAELDDAVMDRLRAAGTFHVIAISGGNVALVVAFALVIARLVVRSGRLASLAALVAVSMYGLVVHAEPSVTRAVTAAAVYLCAALWGIRIPAVRVLALVALVRVVAQPLELLDAGAWLSFGATFGIICLVPRLLAVVPLDHLGPRLRPVARAVLGLSAATIAAELMLLPIQSSLFGRVGVAGVVANLIAVPAMALVQLGGFAVVLLDLLWPPAAGLAGGLAHAAVLVLTESARIVELVPALVWWTPPASMAWVCTYYGAALIWVTGLGRRDPVWIRRAAAAAAGVAAFVICAGAGLGARRPPEDRLRLTVIDVGQGDGILLQFPTGHTMLVDAGGGDRDIGRRVVVPALWSAGVRQLDWLVITHADLDHIGGAADVAATFRPREIWEGVPVPGDAARAQLLASTIDAGVLWRRVTAGHELRIGAVVVEVMSPPRPDWERPRVRNEDSVVIRIRYGAVDILLTGDAGAEFEATAEGGSPGSRLRVVKVGHHGSRGSTSEAFVLRLQPDVALVSVGRDNPFGHPAPEVLNRFAAAGAELFRTDLDGGVVLETDGREVRVATATGRRYRLLEWRVR